MQVHWKGTKGYKNLSLEVDHAFTGAYSFSLCIRNGADDPHNFHVWVYCYKGVKHIGGFETAEEYRQAVADWEDLKAEGGNNATN